MIYAELMRLAEAFAKEPHTCAGPGPSRCFPCAGLDLEHLAKIVEFDRAVETGESVDLVVRLDRKLTDRNDDDV